jgi:hypothetical protein
MGELGWYWRRVTALVHDAVIDGELLVAASNDVRSAHKGEAQDTGLADGARPATKTWAEATYSVSGERGFVRT